MVDPIVACSRCYGTGKLYSPIPKEDGEPTYICPVCKGKKEISLKADISGAHPRDRAITEEVET